MGLAYYALGENAEEGAPGRPGQLLRLARRGYCRLHRRQCRHRPRDGARTTHHLRGGGLRRADLLSPASAIPPRSTCSPTRPGSEGRRELPDTAKAKRRWTALYSNRRWPTPASPPTGPPRSGSGWRAGRAILWEMTNLPAALRDRLAAAVPLSTLTVATEAKSDDGTVKALFHTADGRPIEAVLMRYRDGRRSVCVSSQSGCPLTCSFCATGQMKFGRNLSADEILDQALHFRRAEAIDHVVFMGMGEPTMNIDAVLAACERLPDLGVTHRRTAISTVGWVPGIDRLAECEMPVSLALSLHAPNDGLRSQLMPVNDRYPIAEVLAACERYRAAPPPQGLRRVRDARRGQRPARARPRARRPARPPRLQGQPDPLQPDRRLRRLLAGADRALPGDPRRAPPHRHRPPHPRPRHRRRLRPARRRTRA